MKINDLKNIINVILTNRGSSEISSILETDHLRDNLCLDSFDLAELTVRIEAEYDIDIFENGIINTVGEILNLLEEKKSNVL